MDKMDKSLKEIFVAPKKEQILEKLCIEQHKYINFLEEELHCCRILILVDSTVMIIYFILTIMRYI